MKNKPKNNQFITTVFMTCVIAITALGCGSGADFDIADDPVITNNVPVITSTPIFGAASGLEYSYTLTATDADSGDSLTMSASASAPAWLSFDTESGVLSGTPSDVDEGDNAVTLTVTDGSDEVSQSFTVTVIVPANNLPVITSTAMTTTVVDTQYSYTLTATDADPDDSLSLSAVTMPAWLTFDAESGTLSGTPLADDLGSHDVSLTVTDGSDVVSQDFSIDVTESVVTSFVIFNDGERADWPAWDCCAGSLPTVINDDAEHGPVVEFRIGESPTVMGFIARDGDGAVGGVPFDARTFVESGTLSFDLKMTASPGDTDWKFKIESAIGQTPVEVSLSTSNEGHAAPVLDTWQHYTFNLADLQSAGLDVSKIDVVMIFPAWDTGNGAIYLVDNVIFSADSSITEPPLVANELTIFNDSERADWPAWDCCGGSTPVEQTDDAEHGAVMEFSIGAAPTVMGFIARDGDGAVGGTPFDASDIVAGGTLSFDLKMTGSPGDTNWLLKLESNSAATAVEVSLSTSIEGHAAPVLDSWQRYTFNLADLAALGLDVTGIDVVMIFPAWGTGEGAVYRLDNVSFLADGAVVPPSSGTQIDLPINFDEVDTDYTIIDFGGTSTVLGASPTDGADQVAITTKTDTAETWAGTTMSTNDGLVTAVPVTLANSIMKVWVYSLDAGIPVRLKLENHLDPTQTVETESVTTLVNTWEELTFDFTNEAPGTEPLDPTLHPTWIFDKASIFFNFGTTGADAGEKVYYWDDITFGN